MTNGWIPAPNNLSDKLADWEILAQVGGTDLIRDKVVLDIGPAWGTDAYMLGPIAKRWVALDSSPAVLQHLNDHRIPCTEGDAAAIPFPDDTFDTVIDFSSIDDTLGDPLACYAECARVLKPGGVLISSYANARACPPDAAYRMQDPHNLAEYCRSLGLNAFRREYEGQPRAVMVFRKREPMIPTTREVEFWACAAGFPPNKEEVYPGHADAQEFDWNAGKQVLEYGCGGGSDAMSYLRRGCTVALADIVKGNVERALSRIREVGLGDHALGIVLESSDEIPLVGEGQFDVVSSHGVLHHMRDPLPVLQEFRRVLKTGGILYVMLYTERLREEMDRPVADLCMAHGITPDEAFGWCVDGRGCPYARRYTEGEGWELLKLAGFTPRDVRLTNDGRFRTFRAVKV